MEMGSLFTIDDNDHDRNKERECFMQPANESSSQMHRVPCTHSQTVLDYAQVPSNRTQYNCQHQKLASLVSLLTNSWVIPSETSMRNGHPSQISSKLGTHIIGVEILNHTNLWCPVLYGFLVIMHKICTFF